MAEARGKVERTEPSKGQRAAARRVAESKATIPHLYMSADVVVPADADAAIAALVGAAARVLREVPRLNGAYRDGAPESYARVNVGVQTPGVDVPAIPTIFDAEQKDAAAIAQELADLSGKAAAGTLTAAEVAGGTFTIQPAFADIGSFAPVILGAQAANLGVTGGLPDASVTLAADARMIDAGTAAKFLALLRSALEQPT